MKQVLHVWWFALVVVLSTTLYMRTSAEVQTLPRLSTQPQLLSVATYDEETESKAEAAPEPKQIEATSIATPVVKTVTPAPTPEPQVKKTTPVVSSAASNTAPATTVKKAKKPVVSTTSKGVSSDLTAIGESLNVLRANGIEVLGHNGLVPRRCNSTSMAQSHAQGMAIKTPFTYPSCPDGGQPVYEEFRPTGYTCSVIYNVQAGNKLAILAHEVAHCKYFQKGQFRAFDVRYKKIREVAQYNRSQLNEIIADDMMICHYGLDTNWGSGSYYSLYDIDRPTNTQCSEINDLIDTLL